MADINQTITLGIGTPAGVPEFLLFGLQPAPESALTAEGLEYTMPGSRMHYAVEGRMHYTIPEED